MGGVDRELVLLEVVVVVLSVALVVILLFLKLVLTLVEVEAHNLLGEVIPMEMLSPDRN